MRNQQAHLFSDEMQPVRVVDSFRLIQLEVYNWGPFRGRHQANFDPHGTAIIGPTGSGKTTLVDALMTLLVHQPKYNLASTGGHESDRSLFSYVRGVLGGDGTDGREEVARPGKTLTRICATYQGGDETLRLAGLLWTDGPSNAADDLKKRWIFSQANDQSLDLWLQQLHGDGVRELMRSGRETANLRIFDSKTAYLAHTRKFFDVGENAFTLLNRAAGLKQLNSIDEIFRDLVLDDHSAFDRAVEVAKEFDNLAEIHTELEIARRQQESLIPVAKEHEKLLKEREEVELARTLKRIVPVWFAILGRQKWAQEVERLSLIRDNEQSALQIEQGRADACRARVETLRERYLQLGGNSIGELERVITAQGQVVSEKRKYATEYQRIARQFQLSDELTPDMFQRTQAELVQKQKGIEQARDQQMDQMVTARAQQHEAEKQRTEIVSALEKVRGRPGSNIPPHFQDFRSVLATQLSLPDGSLPFLAELIEIKPEESLWRGAIERAIGSERLRILVPEEDLDRALCWVNHRHNRLHVRLQAANKREQTSPFFPDGYVRKLNFKSHPLQGTAQRLLAGRDRHCVPTPEALKTVEHGLTVQGMMSGRHGAFDKQDQRRLDEDWMTGFDNRDQLEALSTQLNAANQVLRQLNADAKQQSAAYTEYEQKLSFLRAAMTLEFSQIDLPGAEHELTLSRQRLDLLLSPLSDASLAKTEFDAADVELKSIEERIRQLDREIASLNVQCSAAEEEVHDAEDRLRSGLPDEEILLAENRFGTFKNVDVKKLIDAERAARESTDKQLHELERKVSGTELKLGQLMAAAKHVDTGMLIDVGIELEDVSHYLTRLTVLTAEALPEKRTRFLEYLNRSSDQGVTQLLSGIDEEVDAIEQRLDELNQTLAKVDFRSGRYLQLQPQRMKHERLRTLDNALRKVRSAALKIDEGESHYHALRELVSILRDAGTNRRQAGSRALLDPRHRLEFYVVEVDRNTGSQSPRRTGSQSGSGGEKELMASHILTASLSYALCPNGSSQPLYSTVILDEAFSKSSPSAASRIIDALRIFGLHPIFVTPNKEIGLLKQHTRKVICVQRPGKEASLASISWEILDDLAQRP